MKALIRVTKKSDERHEIVKVRFCGVFVYERSETFPDDKPTPIGFNVIPSEAPGFIDDEEEFEDD